MDHVISVTIRDADMPVLEMLAAKNWRDLEQQASFLIEQTLQKSKEPAEPRRTRRSRTHTLVAGVAA